MMPVSGKFSEVTADLDQKEYPLKSLLPAGLFLLEKVSYAGNSAYDRRLLSVLSELYGHKRAHRMLRVHWSNKLLLVLLSLLFLLVIGFAKKPDTGFALFGLLLLAAVFYLPDRELHQRVKKRRQQIQLDFPDFVNKLTLLINAGMSVSRAWTKTASDGGKSSPLYQELGTAMLDISSGMPEHRAYEEFAKRCRVPIVTRFVSVILQNIRKGNAELVPILRVFANECWELRKSTAKRFGEEASTKMLLPMMLMFIAILLIVGMPAVLALKNI